MRTVPHPNREPIREEAGNDQGKEQAAVLLPSPPTRRDMQARFSLRCFLPGVYASELRSAAR